MPINCDSRSVPPPFGLGPPEGGKPTFGPAYRRFSDLARWVERDYAARAPRARSVWGRFEVKLALRQGTEEQALDLAQKLMALAGTGAGRGVTVLHHQVDHDLTLATSSRTFSRIMVSVRPRSGPYECRSK